MPIRLASGIASLLAGGEMNLRRAVALSVWWAIPVLAWPQQPAEVKPVTDRGDCFALTSLGPRDSGRKVVLLSSSSGIGGG
jgi:hypothetical protein